MWDPQIDLRLIELREVKPLTRLHRWEFMHFRGNKADVELSTHFDKDTSRNTVTLQLGAHYTVLRSQIRRRLLDYVIEAEFMISRADGLIVVSDHEMMITPDLLRLMLNISIGAIRGMIALRTAGTALARFPLPVYNLDRLIANIEDAGVTVDSDADTDL